jgi:hypothetical protein
MVQPAGGKVPLKSSKECVCAIKSDGKSKKAKTVINFFILVSPKMVKKIVVLCIVYHRNN